MEGCELEFTAEALRAIARKAMKRDTGARALRSVVEELMLDLMYELPESTSQGGNYVITEEMVDSCGERPTLKSALAKKKESA